MSVHIPKIARVAAWGLTAIIVVLSVVPAWLRPLTGVPHQLEHFAIFFAAGVAFGVGYGRRLVIMAALLVIFCGAIELAQLFAPQRHARWSDFIVDAVAVCVGLAVAAMIPVQTIERRRL